MFPRHAILNNTYFISSLRMFKEANKKLNLSKEKTVLK